MPRKSPERSVQQILDSAAQRLALARQGEQDYLDAGDRRLGGLHTAVTMARSVTFILQNLRGKVDGFDDWYAQIETDLRADPVCKWFVDVRNRIEKQGTEGGLSFVVNFTMSDDLWRHAPLGATRVVIGDPLGRSGWIVAFPDGTEETVWANMPPEFGSVETFINDAPDSRSFDELLAHWLSKMDTVVRQAVSLFG